MARSGILFRHNGYSVRHWRPADRESIVQIIQQCVEDYGMEFQPEGYHLDAVKVEEHYINNNQGEFWVVVDDSNGQLVGSAAYYKVEDKGSGNSLKCAEIRKMFLLPDARGKKLGRSLLKRLEEVIASEGYQQIFVQTATVLLEARQLYQSAGYIPIEGMETNMCSIRLYKDIST